MATIMNFEPIFLMLRDFTDNLDDEQLEKFADILRLLTSTTLTLECEESNIFMRLITAHVNVLARETQETPLKPQIVPATIISSRSEQTPISKIAPPPPPALPRMNNERVKAPPLRYIDIAEFVKNTTIDEHDQIVARSLPANMSEITVFNGANVIHHFMTTSLPEDAYGRHNLQEWQTKMRENPDVRKVSSAFSYMPNSGILEKTPEHMPFEACVDILRVLLRHNSQLKVEYISCCDAKSYPTFNIWRNGVVIRKYFVTGHCPFVFTDEKNMIDAQDFLQEVEMMVDDDGDDEEFPEE